jgi:hypothetical protein
LPNEKLVQSRSTKWNFGEKRKPYPPSQALFGTRVLVGIDGDNPLEYWVKPPPSPNPHKTPPTIY